MKSVGATIRVLIGIAIVAGGFILAGTFGVPSECHIADCVSESNVSRVRTESPDEEGPDIIVQSQPKCPEEE